MLVPIKWLKEYIKVDVDTETFCERMIMSGSNVETTETLMKNVEGVLVGRVLEIEKHPDADKLVVCKIDVAKEEPLTIVTGASNVFVGALVAVATDGGIVPGPLHGKPKEPGGVKIKKGKLRGVESEGMLCSLGELGFEEKVIPISQKEGVWILDDSMVVGEDIKTASDLFDNVVEFEITPNRADCLSMIGMARETAATFGGTIEYPVKEIPIGEGEAKNYINIEIEDPELCKRYMAKIITDVKVEPSPWWLQKKLISAGMRPINNIVDITNFVMLEYGQPLHAFDISDVEGGKIIVGRAEEGEVFTTLDEKERKLDTSMLMIKDTKKNIAIAGVMGGLNSEIKDETKTILLEVANFNGDSIRKTSKKLGLRTEASSRYEKGIDPNICSDAAERVCLLIKEIGAGRILEGAVDNYPKKYESIGTRVRTARVNSLLGTELSQDEMINILKTLEIKCEKDGEDFIATPPTVRLDLIKEIDYVEEVARIYGYDNLPMTIPAGRNTSEKKPERAFIDLAKDVMCSLGANETQTYSFVSPRDIDKIGLEEDVWERNFVELKNPLGDENSVMRTILTPSLLEVMGRNFSRNITELRAFEINTTFSKSLTEEVSLPTEEVGMVIGLYGKDEDFFTLKGVIEELFEKLGVEEPNFVTESEYPVYHPGRCARIQVGDEEVGIMGEVHPQVRKAYGIDTKCYVCEFFFDGLFRNAKKEIFYSPLPKYPAISRDIALIVEADVQVGDIKKVIQDNSGNLLEKVELFDVYRGKQIEEGKKSVAFAMTYRDKEKTLTDEEVTKVYSETLKALESKFKAILREI